MVRGARVRRPTRPTESDERQHSVADQRFRDYERIAIEGPGDDRAQEALRRERCRLGQCCAGHEPEGREPEGGGVNPEEGYAVCFPSWWKDDGLLIDTNTIRTRRKDALREACAIWCQEHGPVGLPRRTPECEDVSLCWRRLYRRGFRIKRVVVTAR